MKSALLNKKERVTRAKYKVVLRAGLSESLAGQLTSQFGVNYLSALVLAARGITQDSAVRSFLSPTLREDLPAPGGMKNLEEGVARILSAINKKKKIAVFSDFDVDGVSSAAQLVPYLKAIGGNIIYYTPNRFTEGYGLSKAAVEKLAEAGANLLVTLDCGATNHEAVGFAKKLRLDVIVVDHHQTHGESPADTFVNPAQLGCKFNEYKLCAAGIVWFLLIELRKQILESRQRGEHLIDPAIEPPDPKGFLDLAALGTICDMVPLIGPNRVIASRGIQLIQESSRPGMVALKGVSRLSGRITSGGISFGLGPRINAAGRLADAMFAYDLLTTQSADRAQELAQRVDRLNTQRREIEDSVKIKAIELLTNDIQVNPKAALAVFDVSFHTGVIGIVAQRLVELFHRPAAVMGPGEMLVGRKSVAVVKGSVRSASGFNVSEALKTLSPFLLHHGGHSEAGGFAIEEDKIENFRAAFSELAESTLTTESRERILSADGEVSFKEIDFKAVEELERLSPFGMGNPSPVFITRNVVVDSVTTVGETHLKVRLKNNDLHLTALCWNFEGNEHLRRGEQINIAHAPEFNTYQGVTSVQLNVKEVWKD